MADKIVFLNGQPIKAVDLSDGTHALAVATEAIVIGDVKIDQTTPGSTNGVVVNAGSALIGKVDHSVTGITSGHQEVTTAGIPVRLVASTTPCKYVIITGKVTNTGRIMVGGSTVDETPATGAGTPLYIISGIPQTIVVPCADAYSLYIDAAVTGEGVIFNILT